MCRISVGHCTLMDQHDSSSQYRKPPLAQYLQHYFLERVVWSRGYNFLCATQLSMKYFLLINVKMPTIVGVLTLMSRRNNTLGLYEPENCCIS